MPNHVTNVVYFNAPSMDALLQLYHFIAAKDENGMKITGSIDFNTIIPMPNELDIDEGTITDQLISIYAYYYTIPNKVMSYINNPNTFISLDTNAEKINRNIDRLTEYLNTDLEGLKLLGRKYIDNIINYNSPTWYEWRCNNWNTKWNAYHFNPITNFLRNYIEFNTAWSHVEPVLLKLNQLFPHIGIQYRYADEDFANNCGLILFENGRVIYHMRPQPLSNWAVDLSARVLEVEPKEYGYTKNSNDIYEYHEEEW